MKKRMIFGIIALLILLISFSYAIKSEEKKSFIKNESKNASFLSNKETTRYNVVYEDKFPKKIKNSLNSQKDKEIRIFDLTDEELLELKKNSSLKIYPSKIYHPFLQDSVGVINASTSWNLQERGINLTGTGQAVCVIDTGINYTHPDFGGDYGNGYKILSGYDVVYGPILDFNDEEGHGTHVAGIVAANGSIKGVAPGASLVIMAAYNYSVEGFYDSDIIKAITHCINNKTRYNISVISMSLGGGQNYSYCDQDSENILLSQKIQEAINQNISVVVSTGNTGGSYNNAVAGIAAPACFQNVTRVGATDKTDIYASYGFRNSNFTDILLAPGTSINSTRWDPLGNRENCLEEGNYMICSGTSMSAPHVSGTIAIINQYLASKNKQLTPHQIRDVLNKTGRSIYDSLTGINFSRIDVYSALLEIDEDTPNVTLVSPSNNVISPEQNQTFFCNATDWQLANITFKLWDSTNNLVYNETKNFTGMSNETNFSVSGLDRNYVWNCFVKDAKNNEGYAFSNNSLIINPILVNLNSPTNQTYKNVNETTFNCSFRSSNNSILENVTFYLWNSSNEIVNTTFTLISGNTNESVFNYNLTNEEEFKWNCLAFNNNSESSWASENFTIIFDTTSPNFLSVSSSVTSSSASITWNTNEETNSTSSIYSENKTNSSYSINHAVIFTGLSSATLYSYNVTSCDRSGNCNTTTGSFTTSEVAVTSSSGGGGGGGSPPAKLTETQLAQGYSKKYYTGEKVSLNLGGQNHSVQLNKIINDSVNITIRSDPITFLLNIGGEKKINLTSSSYYDFYIKVENITKNYANITLKTIYEPILSKKSSTNKTETRQNETIYYPTDKLTEKITSNYYGKIFLIVILAILLIAYFLKRKGFYISKTKKRRGA